MANSTRFPLWKHATGQYGKKIRGRTYYFGTDADEALKKYIHAKPFLERGLQPPPMEADVLTLAHVCNHFLTHKRHQQKTGEITSRTFREYFASCERLIAHFGKSMPVAALTAEQWGEYRQALAKTRNLITVGNEVRRVKCLFNYAYDAELIERPMKFGTFKQASRKALRRQRAEQPKKLFGNDELLLLLGAAKPQMKAMILLGINAGFGGRECAQLPQQAIDFETGRLEWVRPKTGAPRRAMLWPETLAALQVAIATRPRATLERHEQLVFVTKYGGAWFSDSTADPVSAEFRKLQQSCGIYQARRGFYAMRHTYMTRAEECRDFPAVRLTMGHADGDDIADHYREEISDERIRRVGLTVRAWLWGWRPAR